MSIKINCVPDGSRVRYDEFLRQAGGWESYVINMQQSSILKELCTMML